MYLKNQPTHAKEKKHITPSYHLLAVAGYPLLIGKGLKTAYCTNG